MKLSFGRESSRVLVFGGGGGGGGLFSSWMKGYEIYVGEY
jgi:hypothetical protein